MSNIYYIVYKTYNIVNGKYYIGFHSQSNPHDFDGYLGSGKRLKRAINYHGSHNFIRETLYVFETANEALSKERIIVKECINDPLCYNIAEGGFGGNTRINMTISELSNYNRKLSNAGKGKQKTIEHKQKIGNSNKGKKRTDPFCNANFLGKQHTEEFKIKQSYNASQMRWYTDGSNNVKIRIGDPIPSGYVSGRIRHW